MKPNTVQQNLLQEFSELLEFCSRNRQGTDHLFFAHRHIKLLHLPTALLVRLQPFDWFYPIEHDQTDVPFPGSTSFSLLASLFGKLKAKDP